MDDEDNLLEATEWQEEELYEHHRLLVDKGQSPIRIDKFIADKIQNATRNRIQIAIEAGMIRVNSKPTKSNYKIRPGDVITINLPNPPRNDEILPENIPLDIVYEDEDLAIINKPAGMVVHPAYGNWSGTLVNALVYHFSNLPSAHHEVVRPGLVHRIDKDTSGLLVVAKSEIAMTVLAKQFFDHTIDRLYYALVWGVPKEPKGTVRTYLGRHPSDRKITTVVTDETKGKEAITHYEIVQSFQYVSLIQCKLETGRTHQIRAHMKHLGHPLFGDAAYGGDKILKGQLTSAYRQFVENCLKIMPRQALHAKTLGFIHPTTGKKLHFESNLPPDFEQVLKKWMIYAV